MIDPIKSNFTQPVSVTEILDESKISKDDYYRALYISKDEDLELHLKRQPNSCFVNNYFSLKLWQADSDIQHVFNECGAVKYIFQYFSKTEGFCSHAMELAVKEAFESNIHHHKTMKTISKAYLSNRQCSLQEAVYHIPIELKLKRVFAAVCFADTNLPEEGVQVSISQKGVAELPGDNLTIFEKLDINRYMERPSATFCSGKYNILENFCNANSLACYTFENRSSKTCKYQPDKLDDNLVENNHEECSSPSPKFKSMFTGETMRCRKIRQILQYHLSNKLLSPEKFAQHAMIFLSEMNRLCTIVSKQTARTRNPGFCKEK